MRVAYPIKQLNDKLSSNIWITTDICQYTSMELSLKRIEIQLPFQILKQWLSNFLNSENIAICLF